MTAEIVNHHRVEDDDVWPLLEAVAGDLTALVALTEDHERLDPLLARAGDLAAADTATPELAAVLHELADLLARHVADEERDVFPIITERVTVEDYARLQERFRGTLGLAVLTFVVPWVIGHATPDEREVLLGDAPPPLRVLLAVTEHRFRARADRSSRRVCPPADRWTVRLMKRVNRVHQAPGARRSAAGGGTGGSARARPRRPDGHRAPIGRPHTVMLLALHDGDDLSSPASHGGVDREPHVVAQPAGRPARPGHAARRRFASSPRSRRRRPRAVWARFVAASPALQTELPGQGPPPHRARPPAATGGGGTTAVERLRVRTAPRAPRSPARCRRRARRRPGTPSKSALIPKVIVFR